MLDFSRVVALPFAISAGEINWGRISVVFFFKKRRAANDLSNQPLSPLSAKSIRKSILGANRADLLHSQQTFSYTVYASDLWISQVYPQVEHFTNDEKLTENEIVQNHSLSNAFGSIIIRSNHSNHPDWKENGRLQRSFYSKRIYQIDAYSGFRFITVVNTSSKRVCHV